MTRSHRSARRTLTPPDDPIYASVIVGLLGLVVLIAVCWAAIGG